jgi:hypothetical protein
MTYPVPIGDRAGMPDPKAPRWPKIVAIGASIALLALSFSTFYR